MNMTPVLLLFTSTAFAPLFAQAVPPQPDIPPVSQLDEALSFPAHGHGPRLYGGGATGGFTITPSSREQSRQFYNVIHETPEGTPINWTGSVAACNAGTTADGFKKAVILRVNYFRAMAGVPANVTVNATYSAGAQKAALIMSANGMLSHSPTVDWTCHSAEGVQAAGQSNLHLSHVGYGAIDVYMRDPDANNEAVGHRRWVLYPQTQEMGTGDVPSGAAFANALWIFDTHANDPRPVTRETYVAWPPPGYVPYQVVYPRWSFGLAGADFNTMSVTMKQGATNVGVSLEPYSGFIGENTRAWVPTGLDPSTSPPPAADTPYTITVSGVKVGGVTQSPFIYTVTVFNPATAGPDIVVVSLSGPAALNVGQQGTYTHPTINFATGYDLIEAVVSVFSEIEGAENGLANMTADVPQGYDPISTTVRATGARSFHLQHPGFQSQSLLWSRTLLPSAASHLQFKSRLGYATPSQTALVQVSRDGGLSWTDVYTENGNSTLAPDFTQRDVSLAAFAGYPVQVRLLYRAGDGAAYTQTGDTFGWFIDDLTVTGASLVTNPVVVTSNAGSSFTYTPAAAGQRALYVRSKAFQNYALESGTAVLLTVSGGTGGAELKVSSWAITGAQMRVDFSATGLPASPVFKLQTTPDFVTAWTDVAGATLQDLGGGNYRFTALSPGRRAFFRVNLN